MGEFVYSTDSDEHRVNTGEIPDYLDTLEGLDNSVIDDPCNDDFDTDTFNALREYEDYEPDRI